jgi:hypothetical protein
MPDGAAGERGVALKVDGEEAGCPVQVMAGARESKLRIRIALRQWRCRRTRRPSRLRRCESVSGDWAHPERGRTNHLKRLWMWLVGVSVR